MGILLCLTPLQADPHGAARSSRIRYPHVRSARAAYAVTRVAVRPLPVEPPAPKPRTPDAAELYPKTLNADDLYSYRGRKITTYWRSGHAEAVVASHRAPDLRRLDYLAPDAERGRSVVTDATQQWQYDPRSRQLLHRRLAPDADAVADAAESYDLLRTNYIVAVLPQATTYADRKAYVLTITRKADRTLARKLWVDAITGLVLKREIYREDGKLAVTETFSDINYHAPLPRSLFDLSALAKRPGVRTQEEPAAGEATVPLKAVRSQLGGAAYVLGNLGGYRLVSAALTRDSRTPMLHLRYSDGLTLVSLFEQRRTQQRRPTQPFPPMRPYRLGRRDGHISHHSSLITINWDTPALNLTLVGEVAERTMRDLALAADPAGGR